MMSKNHSVFCSILFFLFFCFTASAKNIEKIIVDGNERISDQTIIMFSGTKIEDEVDVNKINDILKNIYESNFFDDVKVNFENKILNIFVIEKPIVENISYQGIKSNKVQEEIQNLRILKPKSSFDETLLKKDRDKIYDVLLDLGYYFSKVETNIEKIENNKINIIYNINLGEKSKIRKISFIGDKIYKDKKLKNIIVSEEYKFWKFISGKKF